jgi:uncharacterized circularly permuted ATP-grasp superfamily protein/uncharacterized alpha-E superfamily protein
MHDDGGPGRSRPVGSRYDEVIDADGNLRDAWRPLAETALGLTEDDLSRVSAEISRFLADDGVTYVRHDSGAEPWHLDPVPLIVDNPTWAQLQVGLAQRAELLNALLVDLYGERSVLRSGALPSSLVYAHSGFLRALSQQGSRELAPLVLAGTDLGRDANGEWRVLAENRRVISQVLPELHHEHPVHRMRPYLSAFRAGLVESAPDGVTVPRIVLLTPGPRSETAFDQAYLASSLGFPMVQGNDLVVHEGCVWIRPSGWPQRRPKERVDVILRRVDADFCDPLELRGDSQLGVAGLAECVRRGTVRVANGLGAGVLENPALLPYLPAVCEQLLGEQLRLPQVPTLWCGDPDSRAEVERRIMAGDETLQVGPIDVSRKSLKGLRPEDLLARIAAAPYRYVGQEILPLSQAPVWDQGRSEARGLVLRTFTVRHGNAYRPLAGGLATVRDTPETAPVTKDVWVLKSNPSDPDHGLSDVAHTSVAGSIPELSPRALDDLFWAGRYAERAESMLRLILATQEQIDNVGVRTGVGQAGPGSQMLLDAIRNLTSCAFAEPDQEFRSLLLDAERVGSAAHSIARMRAALEGVRDQLSLDTWRVFSGVERATRALRAFGHERLIGETAGRMLTSLLAFQGIVANMVRDSGWRMLQAGKNLERALQVSRILAAAATQINAQGDAVADLPLRSDERRALEGILTAVESVVTYRRRYRGSVRVSDVLDLLVKDTENPRSVSFAVQRVRECLAGMPTSTGSTRPERLVDDMQRALAAEETHPLPGAGRKQSVVEFIATGVSALHMLSDAISTQYFQVGPGPVTLSALLTTGLEEASGGTGRLDGGRP